PVDLENADFVIGSSAQNSVELFNGIKELKAANQIRESRSVLCWSSKNFKGLSQIIEASHQLGTAFVDLALAGIWIQDAAAEDALRLSFGILQASRRRMSKTEYIACPSCGRTLFNLQETTARIKAITSHLKDVKIAIMG